MQIIFISTSYLNKEKRKKDEYNIISQSKIYCDIILYVHMSHIQALISYYSNSTMEENNQNAFITHSKYLVSYCKTLKYVRSRIKSNI